MDLLLEKDADLLDFKEKNKEEIIQREKLFEPLIQYFESEKSRTEQATQIINILSKSELANVKYEGQQKREIIDQITKSISKWKYKTYKKGEFLYHFGEDGQKVYLVIKGEAMQLKPKQQKTLEKEIQENKTKLQVVKMFKSTSFVGSLPETKIQRLFNRKKSQISDAINENMNNLKVQSINKSQDEITIAQSINANQDDNSIQNFQQNSLKKLQSTCISNAKFQILKKSQTQVMKLTGFKQLLQNNLQSAELRDLYFDEETYTFKFELDFYLNAGELFGKSAVSEDSCRMNTVVVKSEELHVIEISKSDYLKVFKSKNGNSNTIDENTSSTIDKKPSTKSLKYQLFQSIFDVSMSKLKKFMSFFEFYKYPAHCTLWKKGQTTDKLYIILSGRVEISDDSHSDSQTSLTQSPLSPKKQKKRQVIYETGKGNLFGEFELVDKLNERIFTVKTLEETQVFGIHVNDFRLCENLAPEIVEQIVQKCQVKKDWISGLKSKIKSTLNHYEKNQMLNNQRQEVREFLYENQKSIKEIKIDAFSEQLQHNNPSSPLINRAKEIKRLKESLQLQSQFKKQEKKGSSNQLSPLQPPNKQPSQQASSPNQYLFSSTQIPRQFLKIDLFGDDDQENERKLSKSPSQRQKLARSPSISSGIKRNGMKSTSPVPFLPIDTDKSTQGLSTQMKSQNSPLSPLEKENYFFGSAINEDETSPLFQRKVLKLNKLQIQQGQVPQIQSFSQQIKIAELQDQSYQNQNPGSRQGSFQQLISPKKSDERQINKSIQNSNESRGEQIFSYLSKNRNLIVQRRAQSQPKLFDISGLPSADNTMMQSKNMQYQQSITALVEEGSIMEGISMNDVKLIQNEYNTNNHSSNLEHQGPSPTLQMQPKPFKTSTMNTKLKHIFQQQKENRKNNQYKINLEKRVEGQQAQFFSLSSSYSPIKRKESLKPSFVNSSIQEVIKNDPKQNAHEEYSNQQQQDNQQYPPSIISLTNLNQINSCMNSFSNLGQIPKYEKNPSVNKSINQNILVNQTGQKNDTLLKKINLENSFKEKIQKLLHSRKSSLANPITSTSSLQQVIKEKRQQEDAQQSEEMHAINILNLQQFIDKKRNVSLHNQSQQNLQNQTSDNIDHLGSEERKKGNGLDYDGFSSKQSFMINNKEQSNSKDNLITKKQSNYYTPLNSEKQRQNAQLLNEMFKRSNQCRFKVLNDQKVAQQQQFFLQSTSKVIDAKTRNQSNPALYNTAFFTNMNSPHEQIQQNPAPSANTSFYNQGYFMKRLDSLSSLSPSKPTSKHQNQQNRHFNKLSQSINIHPSFLPQQIPVQSQQQQQTLSNSGSQKLIQSESQPDKIPKSKSPIQEMGATFVSGTFLTSLRLRQSLKQ